MAAAIPTQLREKLPQEAPRAPTEATHAPSFASPRIMTAAQQQLSDNQAKGKPIPPGGEVGVKGITPATAKAAIPPTTPPQQQTATAAPKAQTAAAPAATAPVGTPPAPAPTSAPAPKAAAAAAPAAATTGGTPAPSPAPAPAPAPGTVVGPTGGVAAPVAPVVTPAPAPTAYLEPTLKSVTGVNAAENTENQEINEANRKIAEAAYAYSGGPDSALAKAQLAAEKALRGETAARGAAGTIESSLFGEGKNLIAAGQARADLEAKDNYEKAVREADDLIAKAQIAFNRAQEQKRVEEAEQAEKKLPTTPIANPASQNIAWSRDPYVREAQAEQAGIGTIKWSRNPAVREKQMAARKKVYG